MGHFFTFINHKNIHTYLEITLFQMTVTFVPLYWVIFLLSWIIKFDIKCIGNFPFSLMTVTFCSTITLFSFYYENTEAAGTDFGLGRHYSGAFLGYYFFFSMVPPIPVIKLLGFFFINPGIARITVIEVPIIEDLL